MSERAGPVLALDGVTDLPPGTIAAVVSTLERLAPPARGAFPALAPLVLEPIGGDVARYRALYAAVGEPWLWISRRRLADPALAAILGDPDVAALALREGGRDVGGWDVGGRDVGGRDVGILELDWRRAGEAEIAFLGLVPSHAGRGLGPALMGEALRRAWARPIRRVWVHTCTQDHPGALGFYLRCGFRCVRRAIEVAPDPRLLGQLPRTAGPHHPIIAADAGSAP